MQPHRSEYWCIPPKEDAAFVACMEDILDLYQLPYGPAIPMVCMDEKPYQLLGDAREPLPMRQGSCAKLDSEYVRGGTASIFLFCEALAPWCHVTALPRRTALDWAAQIKELLTVHYPDAPLIRLVMDNLNTHTTASLYKAFPAPKARALARRLEIHYTPKHGSWLNIAECYLSTLSRQCLNLRLDALNLLNAELSAWEYAHRSLNRSRPLALHHPGRQNQTPFLVSGSSVVVESLV